MAIAAIRQGGSVRSGYDQPFSAVEGILPLTKSYDPDTNKILGLEEYLQRVGGPSLSSGPVGGQTAPSIYARRYELLLAGWHYLLDTFIGKGIGEYLCPLHVTEEHHVKVRYNRAHVLKLQRATEGAPAPRGFTDWYEVDFMIDRYHGGADSMYEALTSTDGEDNFKHRLLALFAAFRNLLDSIVISALANSTTLQTYCSLQWRGPSSIPAYIALTEQSFMCGIKPGDNALEMCLGVAKHIQGALGGPRYNVMVAPPEVIHFLSLQPAYRDYLKTGLPAQAPEKAVRCIQLVTGHGDLSVFPLEYPAGYGKDPYHNRTMLYLSYPNEASALDMCKKNEMPADKHPRDMRIVNPTTGRFQVISWEELTNYCIDPNNFGAWTHPARVKLNGYIEAEKQPRPRQTVLSDFLAEHCDVILTRQLGLETKSIVLVARGPDTAELYTRLPMAGWTEDANTRKLDYTASFYAGLVIKNPQGMLRLPNAFPHAIFHGGGMVLGRDLDVLVVPRNGTKWSEQPYHFDFEEDTAISNELLALADKYGRDLEDNFDVSTILGISSEELMAMAPHNRVILNNGTVQGRSSDGTWVTVCRPSKVLDKLDWEDNLSMLSTPYAGRAADHKFA